MELSVIKIGNSKGFRLSKTILEKYTLKHFQVTYHHETKYPGEVIIQQQFIRLRNNNKQLVYDIVFNKNEQRISAEIATKWELI